MQSIGVIEDFKNKNISTILQFFLIKHGNIKIKVKTNSPAQANSVDLLIMDATDSSFKDTLNIKENSTIIINSDTTNISEHFANKSLCIVGCGLSQRATVTASSVEDDKFTICIQRSIFTNSGKEIVPQEFTINTVNSYKDIFYLLATVTALLLCDVKKESLQNFEF